MACQKSIRLDTFNERVFRNTLIIEGSCPDCGGSVAKPVNTIAGEGF